MHGNVERTEKVLCFYYNNYFISSEPFLIFKEKFMLRVFVTALLLLKKVKGRDQRGRPGDWLMKQYQLEG